MNAVAVAGELVPSDSLTVSPLVYSAAQALVAKDKEPITPFIAKVRPLVDRGVSCILVIGGSGDYFDVADVVRF